MNNFSEQCAIALGSNLGDCRAILEAALDTLARTDGIVLQKRSSWYQTVAIGPAQPPYLNGCAVLQSQRSPQTLLKTLLNVEAQFGRVRQERWGPRTLDLDLLLYGQIVLDTPKLQLPHPRMAERAFVLVPLVEIAADWIDPHSGKSVRDLVQEVDCCGVQRLEG